MINTEYGFYDYWAMLDKTYNFPGTISGKTKIKIKWRYSNEYWENVEWISRKGFYVYSSWDDTKIYVGSNQNQDEYIEFEMHIPTKSELYNTSYFPTLYLYMWAEVKQGSGSHDPSREQYFNAWEGDICSQGPTGWYHSGGTKYVPAGTYMVVGYYEPSMYGSGYPIISYDGVNVQMYWQG